MCIHCAHANPSRPCQNQQLQVVSCIFTLSIILSDNCLKYKFGDNINHVRSGLAENVRMKMATRRLIVKVLRDYLGRKQSGRLL